MIRLTAAQWESRVQRASAGVQVFHRDILSVAAALGLIVEEEDDGSVILWVAGHYDYGYDLKEEET